MKAPIVLFAFNRPESFRRCVQSLLANPEAAESDLIVYVDGPRPTHEGEEEKVQAVWQIAAGITGFRSLETHFSPTNTGLGPSVIAGVSAVMSRFGRAIVVEDDLVASGNFLAFMNEGLERYAGTADVFSICGYSNRIREPEGYPYDAYFCPRSSSWGWATWADRWSACDWQLEDWSEVKKNARAFDKWGGSDCFHMLQDWKKGRNQSWAIRFCYNQFLRKAVSLFPMVSKIQNRGFDGNGTNCPRYNRFKIDWDTTESRCFRLPEEVSVHPQLRREALKYHSIPIRVYSRIRNILSWSSSANPRVLFVLPLPPPVHGASMVSWQIMNSRLINDSFQCDFINSATSRSIDEVNHFNVSKTFRHMGIWFHLLGRLLSRRYDLCYMAITCHGRSFLKDVPFVLLCKLFRKKIVFHQHNKGMAADVDRWPYRWLLPLCYRNTKVILLSWYLYDDISRVVPKADVLVCPNGIPVPDTPVASHKPVGGQAAPRLLFLSNLIGSKGILDLLDALRILKERGYSLRCDVVGGESKKIDASVFAEEVENRGLKQVVSYLGKKYGKEKERCFDEAGLFVLPTNNDCFPLVLLEAMAHHLPVVTTAEGGIRDMVEDGANGFICERRNPESLADCIAKLLDDSELRSEMGEKGFEKVKNNFTEQLFEKRLTECLRETVYVLP